MVVKYVRDIPINVCNINQAKHASQRHTICLTVYDQDDLFKQTEGRDKM